MACEAVRMDEATERHHTRRRGSRTTRCKTSASRGPVKEKGRVELAQDYEDAQKRTGLCSPGPEGPAEKANPLRTACGCPQAWGQAFLLFSMEQNHRGLRGELLEWTVWNCTSFSSWGRDLEWWKHNTQIKGHCRTSGERW